MIYYSYPTLRLTYGSYATWSRRVLYAQLFPQHVKLYRPCETGSVTSVPIFIELDLLFVYYISTVTFLLCCWKAKNYYNLYCSCNARGDGKSLVNSLFFFFFSTHYAFRRLRATFR